jgi:uncharacterized C2H2 Zn-finger protein
MGKIHMLPTSLPSRLGYLTKKGKEVFKDLRFFDRFMPTIMDGENQNIYITNDEEIKEGNWVLFTVNDITEIVKVTIINNNSSDSKEGFGYGLEYCKKIILTTDLELIADGVQAIDDEFLEWFFKNPSCESVEIQGKDFSHDKNILHIEYKIIIPKEEQKELRRKLLTLIESLEQEESKPHSFCETPNEKCTMSYCDENGCQNRKRILVEPKEETLEEEYYNDFKMIKGENIIEAAKRFWKESKANPIEMAIFGAEWQEEENKKYIHKLLDIIQWYDNNSDVRPDLEKFEWYEKFKNK